MALRQPPRNAVGRIKAAVSLLALAFACHCGGNGASSSLKTQALAPSITVEPKSETVTAGVTASFTVVAGGTAPLAYQWSENGNSIPGATSSTYTTGSTTATDNGAQFTVVVTNSAGEVTSNPATLTVNAADTVLATAGSGQSASVSTSFTTPLEATVRDASGNAVAGEMVTFTAPASGASATFANGTTTTTSSSDTSGVARASVLTANAIAGSYVVTASLGGVISTADFNLTNLSGSGGSGSIPLFAHVFIVLEENHSFTDVIGNANMPYLNGLANANALATQYYADAHPSLPNYFELTVGAGTSITGSAGDSYNGVITQDNVVRALTAAGKSWKSYAESLPSQGYLGGDDGAYVQHHNPFVYFSDVQQSSAQANNVVPFTNLAADISADALPAYGFIIPNINDDAHDCPAGMSSCTDAQKLATADQWLSANIAPLLASPGFSNSLLIIVFDEAEDTETTHGGGQVAAVLVSPSVKPGYRSTIFYQHESALRLMMQALGLTDFPGAASSAPEMSEFFQ
ncbi:MAG TPA: alkaline phosphatase family protein [Candidatus Sulfotelmatobacter sp.]|nr:alkaline phosphatase family protein [Candidatus Sulfotelmatobacter sp.]